MEVPIMDKLINSSKFFYTVCKVIYGIFNAATWICGGVAVLVWILPESAFLGGTESLNLGPVTITLVPDGMLAPIWVRAGLFEQLLLCFVVLFFSCNVLKVIQKILEPMTQGQPFMDTVAVNLKKLAWLCLVGGFITELAKIIGQALTISQRELMLYFNPELVQNVEVSYEMDMWFLVAFLMLMLMSHVFRYGQQLQQLSDETL